MVRHNNQGKEIIDWLGGRYQGDTAGGIPHGKGRLLLPNGTKYDGEWKEGKPSGWGVIIYSNGGAYKGYIKAGKQDGYGKYRSPDGKIISGLWANNQFIKPLAEAGIKNLAPQIEKRKDIIELQSLTFTYKSGKGVFGLNFSVGKGEIFGFLGPNGAGKTTAIRNLLGFTRPENGRCRIDGLDCWYDAAEIQSSLGYLPGEIAFFDEMSGSQFLDLVGAMRGRKKNSRRDDLIERFEFDPSGRIRKMSKGMKQKLGIVTAFMHDPAVYVLDEPTSGLDPLMQNTFIELILEEKERGKTILMSSHNFEETYRTCDRAGIIREGRLVTVEDVHSLKSSQRKAYLVTLGSKADLDQLRSAGLEIGKISKNTVEIFVSGNYEQFIAALARCTVLGLDVVTQSLEQIFLRYYSREVVS